MKRNAPTRSGAAEAGIGAGRSSELTSKLDGIIVASVVPEVVGVGVGVGLGVGLGVGDGVGLGVGVRLVFPLRSASKLKFDVEGIAATPRANAAAPQARPLNARNWSLFCPAWRGLTPPARIRLQDLK